MQFKLHVLSLLTLTVVDGFSFFVLYYLRPLSANRPCMPESYKINHKHSLIIFFNVLRLRDTPRPLTSKLKWLPEQNTRSIALVGLAEYSAAYPVRAKTALRLQQKRWLDALP